MRLIVSPFQAFGADMGVDLGGDQVGMAEQLLHTAQISARIEQMRGVAVPELVRRKVWIQTGKDQILLQTRLDDA